MWYIHINRHTIDSNRKHNLDEPPIAVRKGRNGRSIYGSSVRCDGPVYVRYGRDGLLPCGAKVVIETELEPEIE
jgi:hypothetical protein